MRSSAMPTEHAVNLAQKLASFSEHWSPRTVATFSGFDVMVVKVQGEFVWHSHEDTDDFFLVLKGELDVDLPDRVERVRSGELFVVPKGMRHRTAARNGEAELLLVEPSGTPNTGDAATAARRIEI